jgi:transcription-repair coupling factor (superfamily II helicase)
MDMEFANPTVSPSLGQALAELGRLLGAGVRRVRLLGCADETSLLALVAAELARAQAARPLVVVTPRLSRAETLARDLEFFLPRVEEPRATAATATTAAPGDAGAAGAAHGPGAHQDDPTRPPRVMLLPEIETTPWADISPDRRAVARRMATLFRLSQGLAGEVMVTSAAALMRKVLPRPSFAGLVDLFEEGEEIDRERAIALLVRAGYARMPVVEDPGTFAVRGGVLDVFVPLYRFPTRIELYGDLVESIRFFDPETQRTMRTVPQLFVHPVRETVVTAPDAVRERLYEAADHAAHPSAKTRALYEQIEAGEDFFGSESLVPALHAPLVPLGEYLPEEVTLLVEHPDEVLTEVEDLFTQGERAYQGRIAEHRIAFPPRDFYLDHREVASIWRSRRVVEAVALEHANDAAPVVRIAAESNLELATELRRAMAERHDELLRPLVRRVREWREDGARTVLVSPNLQHGERLASLLRGYGLEPVLRRTPVDPPLRPPTIETRGLVEILLGPLVHGFRLPTDGMWVVTESEIFGEKATRSASKAAKTKKLVDTSDFKSLEPGGYVVHRLHGVGTYRGLTKLPVATRAGAAVDFLHIEYEGGALYLPVWRLDEVQRYVGAEGQKPRVDKLGGQTWEKTRSKVSREVQKLAEDLLQIYAQRKALPGTSFQLDAHGEQLFREFEATFPFEETPDQQRAIDEVLADMDEARPTDRLVCGDVGYGKTEVAIRAAMKAVLAGKQVAVLAPTTVLVEQHAVTFGERMKDYPVRVNSLSRFRSRAEQTEVLKGMADGKIDIVIGTHRLLSNDVRWKQLGLLIIDEEHRFGVSHKERLKALKTQLDCVTMSATPIPRTLHMSLMGVRDLSIITTPPADRLAIRTMLARLDDAVLVEGIKRELGRGGQIFFVHNRVEDIHKWPGKLRELFPDLRVAVGHGQMPPEELEKVMVDFVDHKYDVLVSTTIIESGLDIGRANTMFVNRADCFGLAQLYQLRGRIGRSKERAYCYLLVPPEASLTAEAKQRLAVLQRFTELGAGFNIASHDLDIRGAGDLLGARQSGQIAAVGFEMYTQLLEEAMATLKGEALTHERDPELTCDLPGFIPEDYLPDTAQRLDFYKRLSLAHNEEEVGELVGEIKDRYGEPPDEVNILAEIMIVKGLGRRLAATAIELSEQRLALALDEKTPLKPEQVLKLVNKKGTLWRLTPDMRLVRTWSETERPGRLPLARRLLGELLDAAEKG